MTQTVGLRLTLLLVIIISILSLSFIQDEINSAYADEFEMKMNVEIIGKNIFEISKQDRFIRADLTVTNYDPSNGYIFQQFKNIDTKKIVHQSEIFLSNKDNGIWSTSMGYMFTDSNYVPGNYEVSAIAESGLKSNSVKFSLVEKITSNIDENSNMAELDVVGYLPSNENPIIDENSNMAELDVVGYLPSNENPIIFYGVIVIIIVVISCAVYAKRKTSHYYSPSRKTRPSLSTNKYMSAETNQNIFTNSLINNFGKTPNIPKNLYPVKKESNKENITKSKKKIPDNFKDCVKYSPCPSRSTIEDIQTNARIVLDLAKRLFSYKEYSSSYKESFSSMKIICIAMIAVKNYEIDTSGSSRCMGIVIKYLYSDLFSDSIIEEYQKIRGRRNFVEYGRRVTVRKEDAENAINVAEQFYHNMLLILKSD